jgi:hypothetical protein
MLDQRVVDHVNITGHGILPYKMNAGRALTKPLAAIRIFTVKSCP